MFEVGTGGFHGKKSNPNLTHKAEPNEKSKPDSVLKLSAIVPEGGYKKKPSESDLNSISIYSPNHPRQHYSDQYEFMPQPVAHGRYTLAAAIKLILFRYGQGNVEKFRSAKVRQCKHRQNYDFETRFCHQVRFAEPVYLGEKVEISTWKADSRILFQGDVHRNGKTAKVLSGGYVDLTS